MTTAGVMPVETERQGREKGRKAGDDASLLLLTQKGAVPRPVEGGEESALNKAVFYGKVAPSGYTHFLHIMKCRQHHPPGKSLLRKERNQKPPGRTHCSVYTF